MYTSQDIRWVKNVKRQGGSAWAYEDKSCSNSFFLNWPSSKPGSAQTPKTRDIILLFQKPNFVNGARNNKVYLTHLVAATSNTVIEDYDNLGHKWCREVELIAMAEPIDSIPNPGYLNFFKPNRGLTNPITNLGNTANLNDSQLLEEIWSLFEGYFCTNVEREIYIPKNPIDQMGEFEGDKIIKAHILFESRRRNSRVVADAKANALKNGKGRIECECCGFDFVQAYGKHGTEYIECHHKIHISKGRRITTMPDLAMVCSNCHRMLHRKNEIGTYFSTEELKKIRKTI